MEPSLLALENAPPLLPRNAKHTFIDLPCLTRMQKLTAAVVIEGANRKYAVVRSWTVLHSTLPSTLP